MRDYSKLIIFSFFAIFLFMGLFVYKDYGIQWDEKYSMNKGDMTFDYIVKMDESQVQYFDYYGTVFDAFVRFMQEALGTTDSRDRYLLKHLITFLLFYISVFFFYLLARNHFQSWKIGLLGSLVLILSPRIFADTFYNPRDIPCMALFIVSFYTLIRYLDGKTFAWAAWHALSSALVINTRITGILVPFLTFAFAGVEFLRPKPHMSREDIKKFFTSLVLYLPLMIFLTILLWPTLWKAPWDQFIAAFKQMSGYPWNSHVLYMGFYQRASELPWHYLLVCMLISTPILYIFCFMVGMYTSVKSLFLKFVSFPLKRNFLLYMAWFFAPLLAIIFLDSIVYDLWRQVFFIYPAFLMISLTGVSSCFEMIRSFSRRWIRQMIMAAFVLLVTLGVFDPLSFMVRSHPFQNMYFNGLIGGVQGAKFSFEMEYWGVSYRKGLEYILKNDPREKIKIRVWNRPGINNSWILPPQERERLVYVEDDKEAEYFLSNYRYHEEDYPYPNEFYSIKIDGVKIMVVYKLK